MAARLGDWDVAIPAAEEARRLAEEFAQPHWEAAADTVISLVAAMRGDEQTAERLAARAEMVAEPVGANITMAFAQFGKVLAALATRAPRRRVRIRGATVRSGRLGIPPCDLVLADRAISPRLPGTSTGSMPPGAGWRRSRRWWASALATWIAMGLRHARALAARASRGRRALRGGTGRRPRRGGRSNAAGFSSPTASGCDVNGASRSRARSCARRATHSTRLDARRGASRRDASCARRANAAGVAFPEARDELTAQELQIAQLAAEGLSNREIGQRLYLSHRTISTHLYRVFPKLGITSRAELSAALAPVAVAAGGRD